MSSPSRLPQLSPEQRKELDRFNQLAQQLEYLRLQIQQLELEKRDLDIAMRETSDLASDTVIYRSTGRILYQTTVDAVKKYLSDEREKVEVRLSSLQSREKKILSSLNEIKAKLSKSQ